jgi:uncharacterized membrane protein YwzB
MSFLPSQFNVEKLFIKAMLLLQRRIKWILISLFVVAAISQFPNSVTHKCVPTLQTELGVTDASNSRERGFCPEGYYPELKWGLKDGEDQDTNLFILYTILAGIIPAAFLIYIIEKSEKKKKSK